jgi:uncharacterized protein YdhG (YjbR/CyaY superfamily)
MVVKKSGAENGLAAVEVYLAKVPEPARTTLEKVRAMIRSAAPQEATERMCYQMASFHYKKTIVAYAAFKDHCSLFPMGSSAIEPFAEELKGLRTSQGTIQFPLDKPLPKALVMKIVKARAAQNEAKARARG